MWRDKLNVNSWVEKVVCCLLIVCGCCTLLEYFARALPLCLCVCVMLCAIVCVPGYSIQLECRHTTHDKRVYIADVFAFTKSKQRHRNFVIGCCWASICEHSNICFVQCYEHFPVTLSLESPRILVHTGYTVGRYVARFSIIYQRTFERIWKTSTHLLHTLRLHGHQRDVPILKHDINVAV